MSEQSRLRIVPLTLASANAGIRQWHRHHPPCVNHRWSLGVEDESGRLCGVAIAANLVTNAFNANTTIEVTRLATDGTPNACSCLYGAMKRIAREMGYERIITYTLSTEQGTSLRAAGWHIATIARQGRGWDMPNRQRRTFEHHAVAKVRWDCWLIPEVKRRPRVKPVFGESYEGTLLEGVL